jgi:hypothetical protein
MHTTQHGDIYVGQARALGAMDILTKPTTDQDLLQVLERISYQPEKAEPKIEIEVDTVEEDESEDAPQSNTSATSYQNAKTIEMPAIEYVEDDNKRSFYGSSRQWFFTLIWLIPIIWLFGLYLIQQKEVNTLQLAKSSLYKSMERLANQNSAYDYGEVPLSDKRFEWLSSLIPDLQRSGFKGVIRIEGHIGEFV